MTGPRELWTVLEAIHDVTYFAPEARAAHEAVGLRGFWRGYFAMRAAPLGEAGAGTVTAVFHNFAPSFVARAVPEVWTMASPAQALAARTEGVVAALRAHLPGLDAEPLAEVTAVLRRIVRSAHCEGRPLAAANAALDWPEDPVAALWHATSVLREHRGDGHVALLVSEGISGLEAHVLRDAVDGSRHLMLRSRGWTEEEWQAAAARLTTRGLLADGGLSAEGRRLREHIERRTDELAAQPYAAATEAELHELDAVLRPLAKALVPAVVPTPNPVGAPEP
ncbi:SCO6745 family protein [Amycolatopsis sacchari]|uniref:SCO6745 family protein n=1 Tax=Amycolatopsis sacchari TaxID=115433 RepID=UPI003EB72784